MLVVAVTGIPDPQPDHALIMVKFARDCMAKTRDVVADLAGRLGEDTLNLDMRVGIHSGHTTAGVLRGDKGRFQVSMSVTAAPVSSKNTYMFVLHLNPFLLFSSLETL